VRGSGAAFILPYLKVFVAWASFSEIGLPDSEFPPPRRKGAKFGKLGLVSFAPLREIFQFLVVA
jgi:hypothetical protein